METLVKSMEEKVNKFEKRLKTIPPIFLSLEEQVKRFEKRLNTIEERMFKNIESESEQNHEQILSEDPNMLNKFKLLEEIVYATKEAMNNIENVSKNIEQESEKKRCKWWNRGYCKFKQSCPYLHPKAICIEEQCSNKECEKRHPNICKNWQKGSCKFTNCEFKHPTVVNQINDDSEKKIVDITINDENFVDYDNIDSDDDSEIDDNFKCQECDFTSNIERNLKKHVKSEHNNTCDKCNFSTSNKMHLKMHIKACHKKNDTNKKRKLTNEIVSSTKKTKNNAVSKKVKRIKC